MVFAVQCPEPRCRKFMLVEEHDRGNVVPCLICKTPIRVGGEPLGETHESHESHESHWTDKPYGSRDDDLSFD